MNRLIFFLLYFSEGAPIGFIWWALPALLADRGFTITQTATISAIATIPWSIKFLLAPMVDLLSMNRFKLKKQLLIYQILMGVGIYFIPQAIESKSTQFLITVIIFHGFFAALQDICIDALAIRSIPKDEVGEINGTMQAGMLIGRSVFGGAGVYLVHKLGLNVFIYFLISSIWISLIVLQRTKFKVTTPEHISFKKYLEDFWRLLKGRPFWLLIGITYFAGFSYNGISTIGSVMLSHFKASPLLHGITYSVFLPLMMASGALYGGYASDRGVPANVLRLNLVLSIITSILVGVMFDHFLGLAFLIGAYMIFYFFIGSTTSSLYGFLMQNTSKEFAALEYSIFMGVVNLCDSTSSYLVGQLVLENSYTFSALMVGVICLFSFLFIRKYQKLS